MSWWLRANIYLVQDLADELRKSKILIVQVDFIRLLMSYPGMPGTGRRKIMFPKQLNGESQLDCL